MKKSIYLKHTMLFSIFSLVLVFFSSPVAFALEGSGTTVARDIDGCSVNITIQIAVNGTPADVTMIHDALIAELSGLDCKIPCIPENVLCCHIYFLIDVRLKSDIPAADQGKFHQILMKTDGNPSNAFLGGDDISSSGTWQTTASSKEIVHETMHLLGLSDQYCGRHRNRRGGPVIVEIDCTPATACCVPGNWAGARCSVPCPGHETDIMATIGATITVGCATNVIPVVAAAGLNSCPALCCPPEFHVDIDMITTLGGTSIIPDNAVVPQNAVVTWSFTSFQEPNAPTAAEVVLPQNSPVNFGTDGQGHPIFHVMIQTGQSVTSTPAVWIPGVFTIKYDINLYQGPNLMQHIDPYLTKPVVQSIPTLTEWGLIFLAVVLMGFGTVYILKRQ